MKQQSTQKNISSKPKRTIDLSLIAYGLVVVLLFWGTYDLKNAIHENTENCRAACNEAVKGTCLEGAYDQNTGAWIVDVNAEEEDYGIRDWTRKQSGQNANN